MGLKEKITELAIKNHNKVVDVRRHLHANPELSFQEYNTAAYIATQLEKAGIPYNKGVAGTGIVALITGTKESGDHSVVALRADMDALPIQELNEVEYKSKNAGVMHACGHDVHSASLLGAAAILAELKEEFSGTVKLIFQPGEEKLPGGASLMIKDGALKNPTPAAIIGQHVMPLIDAGKVGFRKGLYMASTDELYLTVKGKGGHGAMPHLGVDPVLIAAHIITGLQQVVSRNANPATPSVLSFGRVIANGATNVIPDEVKLEGTFRTFDEKWRTAAHEKIGHFARSLAQGMGGDCEVNIVRGYPVLFNNPELTTQARALAVEYLGEENVEDLDIWMAAEDFAYYTHELPGCFYRLGIRNEKLGITSSVHTPTFNIDEKALETGAGLMAWIAVKKLGN